MNKKYKFAKGLTQAEWEKQNDYCIEFIIETLNELNSIFDVYDYGIFPAIDEKIKFKTSSYPQLSTPVFDIKTKNNGFVRFEYKAYFSGKSVNILNEYSHLQESIKEDIIFNIMRDYVGWTINQNKSNNIEH